MPECCWILSIMPFVSTSDAKQYSTDQHNSPVKGNVGQPTLAVVMNIKCMQLNRVAVQWNVKVNFNHRLYRPSLCLYLHLTTHLVGSKRQEG